MLQQSDKRGFGLGVLVFLLVVATWVAGFVYAPTDANQGEIYRIMFLHVPCAVTAFSSSFALFVLSVVALKKKSEAVLVWARATAEVGALFTALTLLTGSVWGKPTWGTWWVWDARLTSELILFFLYLGYIALTSAIDDPRRGDRAGALIAIVGAINVPIIYFSVKWWNTLHQGASVSMTQAPSMARLMLWAMLLMALAFWLYAIALVFYRVRTLILQRERQAQWVQDLPEVAGGVA